MQGVRGVPYGGCWGEVMGDGGGLGKLSGVRYHNGALQLRELPQRHDYLHPRSDRESFSCDRNICALRSRPLSLSHTL